MRCKIILQDGHRCGNPTWKQPLLQGKDYDVCYAHRKLWKPPNYGVQSDAASVSAQIDQTVKEIASASGVPADYWQRR